MPWNNSSNTFRSGALLTAFEEDVPKYCRSSQVPYLQLLVREAPSVAGQRVTYANFAGSNFRSREIRLAFDTLEQAMIVQRVPGTFHTMVPLLPNRRVPPKLLHLDIGLVTHRLSVDPLTLKQSRLNDLFRGALAEQIVGQEILAQNFYRREPLTFWHRDKAGSLAEVDYLLPLKGLVIPIEVKSGKTGTLRSLIQFMEQASHNRAARIYSGPLRSEILMTPRGKKIRLLSLPFYLTSQINRMLEGWIEAPANN